MVDISRALTSANHVSKFAPDVRLPYMVEVKVTAEQMIAAKGSALAAADVFDLVRVPAGTIIKNCYVKKTKAFAGTSTDLALDFGFTGGDVDVFVDGFAFDDQAVGTIATPAAGILALPSGIPTQAAVVISVLLQAMTGTWTSGSFTIYVECLDVSDSQATSGIVALGS